MEEWLDNRYCITPYANCNGMLPFDIAAQAAPPPPPPVAEPGCVPTTPNTSSWFCRDARSA
jgi:hypothetical protein